MFDGVAVFTWANSITYAIDPDVAGWRSSITRAIRAWDDVVRNDFTEVASNATLSFVPLSDALWIAGLPQNTNLLALNVTFHRGASGISSYVGLDETGDWDPWVVALHEIGHMFGLVDRPYADGRTSLYGYASPHPAGLTADAVQYAQTASGADEGNNSIVLTGRANGTIKGGFGRDTIQGADGAEIIYGNQDNDALFGGASADTLFGGQGADIVYGGSGNDVLYGNMANDTLSGAGGYDRLYGGQGDDLILAGDFDTVIGGLGADTIYATRLTVIGQYDPADTILYTGV